MVCVLCESLSAEENISMPKGKEVITSRQAALLFHITVVKTAEKPCHPHPKNNPSLSIWPSWLCTVVFLIFCSLFSERRKGHLFCLACNLQPAPTPSCISKATCFISAGNQLKFKPVSHKLKQLFICQSTDRLRISFCRIRCNLESMNYMSWLLKESAPQFIPFAKPIQ